MTRIRMVCFLFFLLVPSHFFGQKSRVQSAVNKAWPSFWANFTVAMNKKDRKTLPQMVCDKFLDPSDYGELSTSKWIEIMDEQNSWRDYQRSLARGTKPATWVSGEPPTRWTRDDHLYFEFRNGKWCWAGLAGD